MHFQEPEPGTITKICYVCHRTDVPLTWHSTGYMCTDLRGCSEYLQERYRVSHRVTYERLYGSKVTLVGGLSQELLDQVLNQPGGIYRYIEPIILCSSNVTVSTITLDPIDWPTNVDEELDWVMRYFYE